MDAIELIELLGGTSAVADLTNVKPPSVSGWKEYNRIPDDKLIRLAPIAEARGIATRKELFPDDWSAIWPELVATTRIKLTAADRREMVRRQEDRDLRQAVVNKSA